MNCKGLRQQPFALTLATTFSLFIKEVCELRKLEEYTLADTSTA
jgi:hypothetical protein